MRLTLAAAAVTEAPMVAMALSTLSDNAHRDGTLFPKQSFQEINTLFPAANTKLKLFTVNDEKKRIPNFSSIATKTRTQSDGSSKLMATECDPNIAHDYVADPDVGILACGPGQYCMESVESTLGGLCYEKVDHDIHRNLAIDFRNGCNNEGVTCSSCTFDPILNVGSFSCVYDTSCRQVDGCNGVSEICFSKSFNGVLTNFGLSYQTEICISSEQPVAFTYCFNSVDSYEDTCEVEINGKNCDACKISSNTANPGFLCHTFDCGNIIEGLSGDTCGTETTVLMDEIVCAAPGLTVASAVIALAGVTIFMFMT